MKKLLIMCLAILFATKSFAQVNPYHNNDTDKKNTGNNNKQPTAQGEDKPKTQTQVSRTGTSGTNGDIGSSIESLMNLSQILNDRWSPKFAFLKFQLGLGYQSLPVVSNTQSSLSSQTDVLGSLDISAGLKLGIANNKAISFHLSPFYNYGYTGIKKGLTGGLSCYGSTATLFISNKKTSTEKLAKKIFFEGGYQKINGVITDDNKGTNMDIDYSTITAGAGIFLQYINDDNKEFYVKPGIYFHKPSFLTGDQKPSMVSGLEINILSNFIINAEYSQNYFIGGVADYKSNFNKTNQNYFKIKLIKNGKIF